MWAVTGAAGATGTATGWAAALGSALLGAAMMRRETIMAGRRESLAPMGDGAAGTRVRRAGVATGAFDAQAGEESTGGRRWRRAVRRARRARDAGRGRRRRRVVVVVIL